MAWRALPARLSLLAIVLILAACTSAPPGTRGGETRSASQATRTGRTLTAAVRVEPGGIATRAPVQAGVALYLSKRLFNAELALLDTHAEPRPYLAESLPTLNTGDWQVFPDGTMETRYHLKPNLTWHDGQALTAEDFVFAWRVYRTPELGFSNVPPYSALEEVTAPDERTIVMRWSQPYPDAGSLSARDREFPPLPRHILEHAYRDDAPDAFYNEPYWTRQYVGLGPFTLDRWEPGAFIEASAFAGHALGRAKIERIRVLFMSDANTVLANMLTGEVLLSADTSLRLEEAETLKQEWAPRKAGTILQHANQWRASVFQLRPELATPGSLRDARVRKALAHAVDKAALNDALYHGEGIFADVMVSPASRFGAAVDRAIAKYPYDVRRTDQLMREAGFTRSGSEPYTGPDGRFSLEAKTNAAADNTAEQSVLASGWRDAGFEITEAVLPAALAQDPQARATFPGVYTFNTNIGEPSVFGHAISQIPSAENRWRGNNRGGWINADFDRLTETFATTLDPAERERQMVRMMQLFADDLPAISLFFRTQPWAFAAALRGLETAAPEASMAWNIHEWTLD
jgi:peptide/nickel transport system substrate-binding protein